MSIYCVLCLWHNLKQSKVGGKDDSQQDWNQFIMKQLEVRFPKCCFLSDSSLRLTFLIWVPADCFSKPPNLSIWPQVEDSFRCWAILQYQPLQDSIQCSMTGKSESLYLDSRFESLTTAKNPRVLTLLWWKTRMKKGFFDGGGVSWINWFQVLRNC